MNQCLAGKFVSACPVVFSAGLKENQVAYAYLQAGDFYYLVGPVRLIQRFVCIIILENLKSQRAILMRYLVLSFIFSVSNILLMCNLFRKEILSQMG